MAFGASPHHQIVADENLSDSSLLSGDGALLGIKSVQVVFAERGCISLIMSSCFWNPQNSRILFYFLQL